MTQATQISKVTILEAQALRCCLNYKRLSEQLSDNFSNGGLEEFVSDLSITKNSAKGVMGSLTAKGLGWNDEEYDIFWLTEEGVHTAFDALVNQYPSLNKGYEIK